MSENLKENAPDAQEIPSSVRKTAARRTLKLTIPTFETPESRQQSKPTEINYKTGRVRILSAPQTAPPCTNNLKNVDENDVKNNNICGFDENSMAFDRNEGRLFLIYKINIFFLFINNLHVYIADVMDSFSLNSRHGSPKHFTRLLSYNPSIKQVSFFFFSF